MDGLTVLQYAAIAAIFFATGCIRAGIGFGGGLLLPVFLLVHDDAVAFLAVIVVHMLFFGGINSLKNRRNVDWRYLRKALSVAIVPKLIGVFGLLTLPDAVVNGIIFMIVTVYGIAYVCSIPFQSKNRAIGAVQLIIGGYISGVSLMGAPLLSAVFAAHVPRSQLRDTLFMLWSIMVSIKLTSFIAVGVDLQLRHQLWLLPCALLGHLVGNRFHARLLDTDQRVFYRAIGAVLLTASCIFVWQALTAM